MSLSHHSHTLSGMIDLLELTHLSGMHPNHYLHILQGRIGRQALTRPLSIHLNRYWYNHLDSFVTYRSTDDMSHQLAYIQLDTRIPAGYQNTDTLFRFGCNQLGTIH